MGKVLLMGTTSVVVSLIITIISYISLRYGWGLEVKSWPIYLACTSFSISLAVFAALLQLIAEGLKG